MAKYVITIQDNKDKNSVKINCVFTPAINMKKPEENTTSHALGVDVMQFIKNYPSEAKERE